MYLCSENIYKLLRALREIYQKLIICFTDVLYILNHKGRLQLYIFFFKKTKRKSENKNISTETEKHIETNYTKLQESINLDACQALRK